MKISIVRIASLSGATGTFGKMALDGGDFCSTCEQPWDNNLPLVSCIPAGDYRLLPYDSPVHGKTVVFHNPALGVYGLPNAIPKGKTGRSLCEIHEGNWPRDIKGCIAVGRAIENIAPNGRGVTDSRNTLGQLRTRWGDRSNLVATISWD